MNAIPIRREARCMEAAMLSHPLGFDVPLNELLAYVPETGRLTWLPRSLAMFSGQRACAAWNGKHAGKEAFTAIDRNGYRIGAIFKNTFRAHRVAWALYTGAWPKHTIDHIDGDKSNNHIANLRDVPHQVNCRNLKRFSTNTSGATGVYWARRGGKWVAWIKIGGRDVTIGRFDDFDAALAARKDAERAHGYHTNHGRVA